MLNPIFHKFQYGQHIISLETGLIARQATSSVLINMDDTVVLVTIVEKESSTPTDKNFIPLSVNYQERTYAAGRIPGGFFRREGRPSENEILIARLIDRPIRPLFNKGFSNEIQIIATVLSLNPEVNPDLVAIIGTSTALTLSNIPFQGPIGIARIGLVNNEYVLNPSTTAIKSSELDLIISATNESVVMIESKSNMLSEKKILNAIKFGFEKQKTLIKNILIFVKKHKIIKNYKTHSLYEYDQVLYSTIKKIIEIPIKNIFFKSKKNEKIEKLNTLKCNLLKILKNKELIFEDVIIENIYVDILKKTIRKKILKEKVRTDGRSKKSIRKISIKTGLLPRVHGSALFTRGNTQALVSITLGTSRDAQNIDELIGDRTDNFLFHYNFPPYSVGEIGVIGSPKRREIGHGKLAKRSLLSVMPKINKFPYTIRVVSEITESDGSSSMASVCGASLALMNAGVPIKSGIAGIAMGLIKEKNKYIILSDIIGEEDFFGDMDFKISGNYIGITALQMDIKINGINQKIIEETLYQAKEARLKILKKMDESISIPKKEISIYAPRIYTIKINPEKIKDVIGKGGSIIRMLTEETGTTIEIEDNGMIKISSAFQEKAIHAIRRIKEITAEIIVGKIYPGKVIRIVDFGAFVSIGIGKEGLVHISQIDKNHVEKVSDHLHLNQIVQVKVLELDKQGRLRLSIKAANNDI
ncbi:polyribonucleotide nucleotidyltransferase [Buchnera aphidicola]|uniref:Polyribonucleotide nucleotidyltransferase n=1 Tax=Buchnera aphidicola (Anoecia oenotherae) TaxID=1241833 RepID=A0A4D6XPY8_9GAMM|nr:polyribonucleotide nucleotidyltransferase [Buchnera aphidicola]QCI19412.1 polyribonucleotide nucleotidyltransferase [Buchnera aphidicola (Anoecia oenotherae)]